MTKLTLYNQKRNFKKTKEPIGKEKESKNKKLKFVVQHHLARKDHYDLRLEWNGVYKSFAVPKGPSYNPQEKRLAIQVEDHPLSYGNFEGTIPKGQYGDGTVMLWEKGIWIPKEKPDFNKGPIKFELKGKRLQGAWTLLKYKEDNWLLIKENDEYINKIDIKKYTTSIKSGKTMNEINGQEEIKITNPDKIIFPKKKITKQEIVDYYQLISKRMMPFLENRLISVVRAPNSINKEQFFMKHLNSDSKHIGKKQIKDKKIDNKEDYYFIKNQTGLLQEIQMNSYEFHIWGSKQNSINKPDILVFDLDPDKGLTINKIRQGVKDLKSILDELKLKSYLKTSGGKGYHVFIPLKTSSWKKTEKIAKNISEIMVNRWPNKYTTNIRKDARKKKIFIDYLRNQKGATSVCPYSLRLKKMPLFLLPLLGKNLIQ